MNKKNGKEEFYDQRVLYDQYFNVLLNTAMLHMAKKQTSTSGLTIDKKFPWAAFAPLDLKGRPKASDPFTDYNYAVHIDVHHFRVSEIDISIKKRICTIKAVHEPRDDEHGKVSRSFTRTFMLADNVDVSKIKTVISSDGVLTVTALYKEPASSVADETSTTPAVQKQGTTAMVCPVLPIKSDAPTLESASSASGTTALSTSKP